VAHSGPFKGGIFFFVVSGSLQDSYPVRNRHFIMIDRCYMCKKTGESVDHLLLHYDVASALWSSLFSRFGLSWVMPRQVIDLLLVGSPLEG
jgi:hypothetical protein